MRQLTTDFKVWLPIPYLLKRLIKMELVKKKDNGEAAKTTANFFFEHAMDNFILKKRNNADLY